MLVVLHGSHIVTQVEVRVAQLTVDGAVNTEDIKIREPVHPCKQTIIPVILKESLPESSEVICTGLKSCFKERHTVPTENKQILSTI